MINTLFFFFPFLITTPFVLLHRDLKGKEIKVGLDIFILFPDVGFGVTFYVLGAFCLFLLLLFFFET